MPVTDINVNRRSRATPEESRAAAIDAARDLLIANGPQAVTLKAVSAKVGKSHANLLHHFGSAAGLQSALAGNIVDRVTADIADAVAKTRRGEADAREIVDRTFDAFGEQGAGALASWMILTGNTDALRPIMTAIHDLVDQLGEGHGDKPVHEVTLSLVLTALGDSLLGAPMAEALGLPRTAARDLARRQLLAQAGLAKVPSLP